jgi:hypothetical protein
MAGIVLMVGGDPLRSSCREDAKSHVGRDYNEVFRSGS